MRNLLIALMTVPLLLAGGSYGYVWYSVRQQAAELVEQIAPFAAVRYDSITVSPAGEARVRNIVVSRPNNGSQVLIEEASIEVPHFFALPGLSRQLQRYDMPPVLKLSLTGLKIPLHQQGTLLEGKQFIALGCGDVDSFGFKAMRKMGYDVVKLDAELSYSRNDLMQRDLIEGEFWVPGMAEMHLLVDVPATDIKQPADFAKIDLQLAKIRAEFADLGWNRARNHYCARQADVSIASYLRTHVDLVQKQLGRLGVAPNDELVAAYRRYLSGSNGLRFELLPYSELKVGELASYPLQDAIEKLSLTVALNDQPVHLAFTSIEPIKTEPTSDPAATLAALAEQGSDKQPSIQSAAAPRPSLHARFGAARSSKSKNQLSYLPARLSDISRYIGRPLIVTTRDGREYRGSLQQADSANLAIKTDSSRGSVIRVLSPLNVSSIQVGGYH